MNGLKHALKVIQLKIKDLSKRSMNSLNMTCCWQWWASFGMLSFILATRKKTSRIILGTVFWCPWISMYTVYVSSCWSRHYNHRCSHLRGILSTTTPTSRRSMSCSIGSSLICVHSSLTILIKIAYNRNFSRLSWDKCIRALHSFLKKTNWWSGDSMMLIVLTSVFWSSFRDSSCLKMDTAGQGW